MVNYNFFTLLLLIVSSVSILVMYNIPVYFISVFNIILISTAKKNKKTEIRK